MTATIVSVTNSILIEVSSSLATDISITDVFYNEPIEIEGYETVFASGWSFHQPVLLYSVEVELQFHPLEFTTRDTDEENCVLLFVSTNSSIFLASTIVT